jgi:glutamyl/glutaminyl-tRNA synthetase
MIHDPEGGKLSKRYGATAVGEYREMGYLPDALVNYLALLSWSHGDDEVLERERLVREFELERLTPSAAVFDLAKLRWLQHEYVMALDPAEHRRLFAERLPAGIALPAATALAAAFQPSLVAYEEAPALVAAVLEPPRLTAAARSLVGGARPQLVEFRRRRAAASEWLDPDAAREALAGYRAWGKERDIAARDLLMPLRVALTGREHGPELHFVLAALERRQSLDRLDDALAAAPAAPVPPSTEGDPT